MHVCGYEWCMCAQASRNVCMCVLACTHASVNSRGSQGPEAHRRMRQNSLGVTSSPLELNIPTSMWEEKTPSSAELLALECEGLHVTVPSVAALWEPWLPGIPCPPPPEDWGRHGMLGRCASS